MTEPTYLATHRLVTDGSDTPTYALREEDALEAARERLPRHTHIAILDRRTGSWDHWRTISD